MSDRPFSHSDFGKEVRIEQHGTEIHLVFKASTMAQADDFHDELLRQLKAGAFHLTLTGTPTSIEES